MAKNILKDARLWIGLGGVAVGLFASSKAARKLAVKTVACGMKTKDRVNEGWTNIKEEATDIYEEAKAQNAPADEDAE